MIRAKRAFRTPLGLLWRRLSKKRPMDGEYIDKHVTGQGGLPRRGGGCYGNRAVRVVLHTHGCRQNHAESDALEAALLRAGHDVVDDVTSADMAVLNSCTITHNADADMRKWVRRMKRDAPHVSVWVTGCAAQGNPQGVAAMPEVDGVLGNLEKDGLAQALRQAQATSATLVSVTSLHRRTPVAASSALPAAAPRTRVRALLKVQDGCNYQCSFCIVPSVRGPSRSLPIERLRDDMARMVEGGAREVVLTGIHLGTWGRDLRPRKRLHELVDALLPALGPARLRLSSIDPHEVDEGLIALLEQHPTQLCRHVHLPVQSGDPDVLRRMRRGHTAEDFDHLARTLLTRLPDLAIGTDVIVGFPSETAGAFQHTHNLLAAHALAYHHVFRYSPRTGTAAAQWPDDVPSHEKARRNRVLRELSAEQAQAFVARQAGATLDGIVETTRGGEPVVLTGNYLRLKLVGSARPGSRVRVRVDEDGGAQLVT